MLILGFFSLGTKASDLNQQKKVWLQKVVADTALVEITSWPGLFIDLRYATVQNFMKKDIYSGLDRAYLHKDAGVKLKKALKILKKTKPELRLKILDALRPHWAQKHLWAMVRGTPDRIYVSNPAHGSIHSYGMALDITLADSNGVDLDMGTEFDDLSLASQPQQESAMLAQGVLNQTQINNRKILRSIMVQAGFYQLPTEWWHFNAMPSVWVRENMEFKDY
jgi:D-alanyl-D-alanine dipeptidase